MKIYELANLLYAPKDKKLGEMFFIAKMKERKKSKHNKEPKGKAEEGSYCPKIKVGQSWSYTKDKVEKENDGEDVA